MEIIKQQKNKIQELKELFKTGVITNDDIKNKYKGEVNSIEELLDILKEHIEKRENLLIKQKNLGERFQKGHISADEYFEEFDKIKEELKNIIENNKIKKLLRL